MHMLVCLLYFFIFTYQAYVKCICTRVRFHTELSTLTHNIQFSKYTIHESKNGNRYSNSECNIINYMRARHDTSIHM